MHLAIWFHAFLHSDNALLQGTRRCYDPLPLRIVEIRIGIVWHMCNGTQLENGFNSRVLSACGVPRLENDTIGEQVLDFLDGRTNGEDLLHGLYDYVLEEPIPERMRALFQAEQAAGRRRAKVDRGRAAAHRRRPPPKF